MACGDPKAAFRLAILDPLLTRSQARQVTAVTGYDAISHAVESYVTTRRNAASQCFAREAWRLLAANYERVLCDPDDLEARGAMQLGAHLPASPSSIRCSARRTPAPIRSRRTTASLMAWPLPHCCRTWCDGTTRRQANCTANSMRAMLETG